MSARQYDLIVFGATGYTGKLTAEHIAVHLPTDIKWAIAGRSANKLKDIAAECKVLNPDRTQPQIEVCGLDEAGLNSLVKKTTIFITTVGPYSLYGEPAFKACAENGTHYLDVTGEVPYVADMIKKYEATAKASGAIMIPQIGIESAPPDLITYCLVNMIRERMSANTGKVVVSVHELGGTPSGGTLNSVFSLFNVYSLKQVREAHKPFGLSPIPGPKTKHADSLVTKIFGICTVPDLGILTTSLSGLADAAIVQRSWGLLGNYGPNFSFREYLKARNHLTAIMFHFALVLGSILLLIPFFRKTAGKYVAQPGEGATKEEAKNKRVEWRGVGEPDIQSTKPSRAFCRMYYEGQPYEFTGVLLAQAAISILRDNHNVPAGILTPACLGQKFIDRLEGVGVKFEKKIFQN